MDWNSYRKRIATELLNKCSIKNVSKSCVKAEFTKCPVDDGDLDECWNCNKSKVCYVLHHNPRWCKERRSSKC